MRASRNTKWIARCQKVGKKLKTWRLQANIGTREMARMIGVSSTALTHLEGGIPAMGPEKLARYLDELGAREVITQDDALQIMFMLQMIPPSFSKKLYDLGFENYRRIIMCA